MGQWGRGRELFFVVKNRARSDGRTIRCLWLRTIQYVRLVQRGEGFTHAELSQSDPSD